MKKNNVKDPKITPELGADKDGMQKGGIDIQTTMPNESQTVDVKGTRRIRPDKKPVKATWYQYGVVWFSKGCFAGWHAHI